jgi:CHAD domain-containing protein
MEFKLNKIDVEIRQRVKDTTKSGVIHRKESIAINKDRNPKDNSKSYEEFKDKLLKYEKDHKITVSAFKNLQYDVEVFKDNLEKEQRSIGNFIDTKK